MKLKTIRNKILHLDIQAIENIAATTTDEMVATRLYWELPASEIWDNSFKILESRWDLSEFEVRFFESGAKKGFKYGKPKLRDSHRAFLSDENTK